jgi:hypothetical protein
LAGGQFVIIFNLFLLAILNGRVGFFVLILCVADSASYCIAERNSVLKRFIGTSSPSNKHIGPETMTTDELMDYIF